MHGSGVTDPPEAAPLAAAGTDRVGEPVTTPVNAPAFFPGPHRFFNREYLTIVYRSDPEALRRVVTTTSPPVRRGRHKATGRNWRQGEVVIENMAAVIEISWTALMTTHGEKTM